MRLVEGKLTHTNKTKNKKKLNQFKEKQSMHTIHGPI